MNMEKLLSLAIAIVILVGIFFEAGPITAIAVGMIMMRVGKLGADVEVLMVTSPKGLMGRAFKWRHKDEEEL